MNMNCTATLTNLQNTNGQQSVMAGPVGQFGTVNLQDARKIGQDAALRDIDFLKARFIKEFGVETNDILTLFSFW